jgi:hypothetical protein
MTDRDPIDRPFLFFVLVAALALIGVCVAIYPH